MSLINKKKNHYSRVVISKIVVSYAVFEQMTHQMSDKDNRFPMATGPHQASVEEEAK